MKPPDNDYFDSELNRTTDSKKTKMNKLDLLRTINKKYITEKFTSSLECDMEK